MKDEGKNIAGARSSKIMQPLAPVITLDGPSGCGKGTIAAKIVQALGWNFLDSGVLYRSVALNAQQQSVATDDIQGLIEIISSLDISFQFDEAKQAFNVLLGGIDITLALRDEAVSRDASKVAAIPEVRTALVQHQRMCRRSPGLVTDGRDMGTVIFPDAELKFFLTASLEERTQRRYKQLIELGMHATLPDLKKAIATRDKRDVERSVAPLTPAEDAIVIDTTDCDIEQVFQQVMVKINHRFGEEGR